MADLGDEVVRAAGAVHRLGGDVPPHHHLGIHGGEVELRDVAVPADLGLVDEAALVGHEKVPRRAEVLGLLLLHRDQDAVAPRPRHLHRAQARADRAARGALDRDLRDARDLEEASRVGLLHHEAVLHVEMPPPE